MQSIPSYLPEPGDLLAQKYRVLRTIGRGGMGIVFAATHELLHQTVAIKLLVPELAAHPDAIGRFLNEARASARIRSEHVATVMDVGTLDGGAAYMVMELLEGSDLEALLAADGVMSVEKVTQCMLQALEGIAHAHALGIIHRDLKPSNLFLSVRADGSLAVKVLDFGISKAPRKEDDGAATQTHEMLGSPLFMSPEQVRSAKTVDARSDLWSLGVIMYRLLTGTTPFVGDNFGEVLAAILVQPYTPVAKLRPSVPLAFSEIIDRCLERDRERRYANAAELAMALEPFAGGHTDSVGRVCRVLGVRRDARSPGSADPEAFERGTRMAPAGGIHGDGPGRGAACRASGPEARTVGGSMEWDGSDQAFDRAPAHVGGHRGRRSRARGGVVDRDCAASARRGASVGLGVRGTGATAGDRRHRAHHRAGPEPRISFGAGVGIVERHGLPGPRALARRGARGPCRRSTYGEPVTPDRARRVRTRSTSACAERAPSAHRQHPLAAPLAPRRVSHPVRLPTAFALAFAVVAVPAAARAQATESSTIAESLFRDAQSRLAAGDIPAACDLFAKSQRVEAALGTLLNLASCHARDGKSATAWTEFQDAVAWAVRGGDHAREQYARTQVASLDAKLHRVVIEVMEPGGLMQVLLDGAPLPREALGTAVPLDPGEHTIEVTAPGKATWVRKINLGPAAGTDRIEVRFEPLGAAPTVPMSDRSVEGTATPAPASNADLLASPPLAGIGPTPARTRARRTAGIVVAGVGSVGIGIAIGFGVAMAVSASRRDSACPAGMPCSAQDAFDDDHAARLDQQGLFIAGGLGIAALAAGTYLLLTSRHAPSQAGGHELRVGLAPAMGGGGLHLAGSF